ITAMAQLQFYDGADVTSSASQLSCAMTHWFRSAISCQSLADLLPLLPDMSHILPSTEEDLQVSAARRSAPRVTRSAASGRSFKSVSYLIPESSAKSSYVTRDNSPKSAYITRDNSPKSSCITRNNSPKSSYVTRDD